MSERMGELVHGDFSAKAGAKRTAEPLSKQPRKGGSSGGDGMEGRIAALETHVDHIREDIGEIKTNMRDMDNRLDGKIDGLRDKLDFKFMLTWTGLIAAVLGLAGMMAKGFHWL